MYKDPNIKNLLPPRDRVYQCPCGWTAEIKYISSHKRRDKKDLDPVCRGKATPAPEGAVITFGEHEGWVVGKDGKALKPLEPLNIPGENDIKEETDGGEYGDEVYEFRGDDGFLDPEEVARQLNLARQQDFLGTANDATSEIPPEIAPGDYFLEPPTPEPQVSTLPEKVTLPVIVRVMYDWAKSRGWNKGDGSLSAFVTDVLLDYWNNCMGMIVVVARRDEIGVDRWLGERALSAAPVGNGKKGVDK
jgi:hypothetical protein